MRKKVLVTGGSGFLGMELLKLLSSRKDMEIYSLMREGHDVSYLESLKIKILWGDLFSIKELGKELRAVDIVYHLAAATAGTHTDLILNTVAGTENLLKQCGLIGIKRFVLVSSFSVYGLSALSSHEMLDEKTPIESNPYFRDSYSISKIKQEKITGKLCKEKIIPLVIVRPGKIYGPGCFPIPPQLGLNIPGICFLYIGGNALIPFTHVHNCAEAICLAGIAEGVENEVFNIVDDDLPTQKDFIKLYNNKLGPIPRMVRIPFRLFKWLASVAEYGSKVTKGNIPPLLSAYRADNLWKPLKYSNKKAKTKLGWQPKVTIKNGLAQMLDSVKVEQGRL